MIQRIVKLSIEPQTNAGAEFRAIFEGSKAKIAQQPGCAGVKLLQSEHHFFTYSLWQSEADLNAYRESALFGSVWPKTKALFYDKPEAWTCQLIDSSAE